MKNHSTKYPLVTLSATLLDNPVQAEICSAEGSGRFEMNDLAVLAHCETLAIGTPFKPSDISGEPGYVYRTSEVELALTADELFRFLRHNLDPDEFFVLAKKFGVFFEIHSDFYDENTGKAMQPSYGPEEKQSFFYRCLDGVENPENIDNYVERWHNGDGAGKPLHRYLGMTFKEYGQWATNPQVIYKLLFERLRDTSL